MKRSSASHLCLKAGQHPNYQSAWTWVMNQQCGLTIALGARAFRHFHLKWAYFSLVGVAQWTGHGPAIQRSLVRFPVQGTWLGCGTGPQQKTCERQSHIDVYLPLFLFPCLLCKNKNFKSLKIYTDGLKKIKWAF